MQKPDACVQLGYDVNVLIVGWENTHKSGVMSRYLGNVGILAVAKLGVAVATDLVLSVDLD